jgi:hypothetical protein
MSHTNTPRYAPFTSRLERYAWWASLSGLLQVLVFMVTLWE